MAVNVKAYYGEAKRGEIRRFLIESPLFYAHLREKIGVNADSLRLFWIDGDGDLVSLASDDDLRVAVSALEAKHPLRVVVREAPGGRGSPTRKPKKTAEQQCPRRQSRRRAQQALPLLFPTDLLGTLIGAPSSDPLGGWSYDSCLSDFIKLWNAVAWVSKEQQGKRAKAEREEESASDPETSAHVDTQQTGGEDSAANLPPESPAPEVEARTNGAERVVGEGDDLLRGNNVEQTGTGEDLKEEPLNVDLRQHQTLPEEVIEDGSETKDAWRSSLARMEEMGFKDEGGWLSKLLQAKNGNTEDVLETLRTIQGALDTAAKQE